MTFKRDLGPGSIFFKCFCLKNQWKGKIVTASFTHLIIFSTVCLLSVIYVFLLPSSCALRFQHLTERAQSAGIKSLACFFSAPPNQNVVSIHLGGTYILENFHFSLFLYLIDGHLHSDVSQPVRNLLLMSRRPCFPWWFLWYAAHSASIWGFLHTYKACFSPLVCL